MFVREKSGDVDDVTLLIDVVLSIGVSQKSYTLSSCYFVELLGTSRRVFEDGCSIRCKLTANGDASNVLALCHGVVGILLLYYKQPNVLAVIKMS